MKTIFCTSCQKFIEFKDGDKIKNCPLCNNSLEGKLTSEELGITILKTLKSSKAPV